MFLLNANSCFMKKVCFVFVLSFLFLSCKKLTTEIPSKLKKKWVLVQKIDEQGCFEFMIPGMQNHETFKTSLSSRWVIFLSDKSSFGEYVGDSLFENKPLFYTTYKKDSLLFFLDSLQFSTPEKLMEILYSNEMLLIVKERNSETFDVYLEAKEVKSYDKLENKHHLINEQLLDSLIKVYQLRLAKNN